MNQTIEPKLPRTIQVPGDSVPGGIPGRITGLTILLAAALLLMSGCPAPAALRAGTAKSNITTNGCGDVHDSLYVRALVLESGPLRVAILSRDVIAIGGIYGTLTEIGHALQSGIPVIGLNTWVISRNGREDGSIIPARTPTEAVEKALDLARAGE